MPNFKPKSNKTIKYNKKTAVTLDNKHKEFLNDFMKDDYNTIPELKMERQEIQNKINSGEVSLEARLDMEDQIKALTERIKGLKTKKKEYFLDNSKYIFEYFENKKDISVGNKAVASTNKSDICKVCHVGELIPLEDEGVLVCNNCSRSIPYLIENEKPSYKEPPKEVCFYAYKRINHFKEILSQFQGKETTQIPPEVVEDIKVQIKKERIDISQITNAKTKEVLKKLGYNKYYEHIPFIKDKLGIKPPVMSPELEETLCNLFSELQAPYSKYCPDDRVNFLNYYYTAYKLCELLGEDKYLPLFPLLKDKEKRIEQDAIWKQICKELDWEFIHTV